MCAAMWNAGIKLNLVIEYEEEYAGGFGLISLSVLSAFYSCP